MAVQKQKRERKRRSQQAKKRRSKRTTPKDVDIPLEDDQSSEKAHGSYAHAEPSQKTQRQDTRKARSQTQKRVPEVWAAPLSNQVKKPGNRGPKSTSPGQTQGEGRMPKRELAVFMVCVMLMLAVIPFGQYVNSLLQVKDNLRVKVTAAQKLLTQSVKAGEWEQTAHYLSLLEKQFAQAAQQFPQSSALKSHVISVAPTGNMLVQGNVLLNQAEAGAQYGGRIAEQLAQTRSGPESDSRKMGNLTESFVQTAEITRSVLPDMRAALGKTQESLNELPTWMIPSSVSSDLERAQQIIPPLQGVMRDGQDYLDMLLEFAGQKYKRKYLFVFQNNQEVRASGGFIGTYGVMRIHKGEVENLDIQSIYDADGQLRKRVIPPKPLQSLTRQWHLRDANWFADFPVSAQRMIQFYEHTGGPTVDGVIALTPPVVRDLVEVVGPIEMPEYNTTVTADEFVRIVQQQTSVKYDKERNNPKAFINDLAPKILERVFTADKDKYQQIANVLARGAHRKQFLLYAQDEDVQQKLEKYNLSGSLLDAPQDYLAVINSNIGGKKTDGVIEQQIDHNVSLKESGEVVGEVTITREHNGGNTKYPRWNAVNKDYMRIFIPKGSTLLHSTGFESYTPPKDRTYTGAFKQDERLRIINQTREEKPQYNLEKSIQHDKTVFSGWTTTRPQETSKVTIKYKLPFELANQQSFYSLITQKQAGTAGSRYNLTVDYPKDYTLSWQNTSVNISRENGALKANTILRTDQYFGGVFRP